MVEQLSGVAAVEVDPVQGPAAQARHVDVLAENGDPLGDAELVGVQLAIGLVNRGSVLGPSTVGQP
ncbi:MAG TPA: hypothetical protein VGX25_18350 [Actinophytocola sp.]|uniref:hypothetical protein n=1 Tax=Actinophytocola sp. TaxID=1872138 RepID=UPI002DDD763A|nr:hypothetical protein [Actinophytocola sp.]HEV2781349.1 hypothetical protein [Actinophytocola sp.]